MAQKASVGYHGLMVSRRENDLRAGIRRLEKKVRQLKAWLALAEESVRQAEGHLKICQKRLLECLRENEKNQFDCPMKGSDND